MHSILIIGQSNMAGRGFVNEVELIINDKLFVLRNGRWQKMYVPVNPDRNTSGISLVESFADEYAKEHDVEVGIIPCADGGTNLDQWAVGEVLFDNACNMAKLALRSSDIVAVLWHQGESDCPRIYDIDFKEKLAVILDAFRDKLNLQDVPFLVGELGEYLINYFPNDNFRYVNKLLREYAEETTMTGFVSADGLSCNPDNLHFNSKSLREFGLRYYEEFKKLENTDRTFNEKDSSKQKIINNIENL